MFDYDLNEALPVINVAGEITSPAAFLSPTSGGDSGSSAYLGLSGETDVTEVIDKLAITLTAAEPIACDRFTPISVDPMSGSAVSTADDRPIIYLERGELRRIMPEAERHLAGTGRHFQRGGSVVEVRIDPMTSEAVVDDLHPLALVLALDEVSAWMKYDIRCNAWSQIDPPDRICNMMAKATRHKHLPTLKGIARQPYLRPDGSLCRMAGYDHATGLFGVFCADEFDVPAEPTREQAEQALTLLDDLLREFEFALPHDRSAALSGMITAAIRPSLEHAPLFHVRAPQIASGKSYLCRVITALASPRRGTPSSFPRSNTECAKVLLSQLMISPAVIEFDNLTGDLMPYSSLCTVLDHERWEDRVLGQSKTVTVGTRTLFLSSGNNVGPVADMTRRCVTVHLNPSCEMAATRAFKRPNLAADVLRERGRYVSAALTVVRAWIVAGRPASPCPPLAAYVEWTELCRQPLLWLGQPDPAAATFESMAEDPDRQALGLLLSCWHEQFGEDALLVRELLARAAILGLRSEEFKEVLLDIAGDRDRVNSKKLGQWIKRHAGRVVDGLRLVAAPKTRNAQSWRVESVVSVKSVAAAPSTETGMVVESTPVIS